jgi:pantothenate kinase-related protein Tda10
MNRERRIEMAKNEPTMAPVTITIKGQHDSGRSTLANLIKMHLEETGYRHVSVEDTKPLSSDDKDRFPDRFDRNRTLRAVKISVVLDEEGTA